MLQEANKNDCSQLGAGQEGSSDFLLRIGGQGLEEDFLTQQEELLALTFLFWLKVLKYQVFQHNYGESRKHYWQ